MHARSTDFDTCAQTIFARTGSERDILRWGKLIYNIPYACTLPGDHFPPLFEGEAFEEIAKKEEWAKHIFSLKAETDAQVVKPEPSDKDDAGVQNSTPNGMPTKSNASMGSTTSSSTSPSLQVNAPAFATTTRWRHLTSKLMKSTNRRPLLGEFLMEFLYLFGENFDYSTMGFTILHGGRYFNVNEERHVGDPMWIDDPMRPGTNIASSHFQISAVAGDQMPFLH